VASTGYSAEGALGVFELYQRLNRQHGEDFEASLNHFLWQRAGTVGVPGAVFQNAHAAKVFGESSPLDAVLKQHEAYIFDVQRRFKEKADQDSDIVKFLNFLDSESPSPSTLEFIITQNFLKKSRRLRSIALQNLRARWPSAFF